MLIVGGWDLLWIWIALLACFTLGMLIGVNMRRGK